MSPERPYARVVNRTRIAPNALPQHTAALGPGFTGRTPAFWRTDDQGAQEPAPSCAELVERPVAGSRTGRKSGSHHWRQPPHSSRKPANARRVARALWRAGGAIPWGDPAVVPASRVSRLRDFPIKPARVLLVYEANEKGRPDAGSMTTSWWGEADLAAEPFEGETELRQMVRDFCARMQGGPEGR
jgi:hypothetical protein